MPIDVDVRDRVVVIQVFGNATAGDELTATVNRLLDEGHREIVLDLAGSPNLDSAGLGVVVRAYTDVASRGGKLRIEGLTSNLRQAFGLRGDRRKVTVAAIVLTLLVVAFILLRDLR